MDNSVLKVSGVGMKQQQIMKRATCWHSFKVFHSLVKHNSCPHLPQQSMVQVETLGEIGVFFTLFVVGLEFSPERLHKVHTVTTYFV